MSVGGWNDEMRREGTREDLGRRLEERSLAGRITFLREEPRVENALDHDC
jgi:hypothetical protein